MLQVRLLGEQSIVDASGTVRARSFRTVALLAFLVVHAGTPQSRQRIAALFWPDSTDEQALTNLRRELHHLRAALDDDPALAVTAKDLCWRDTETCLVDVRTFDLRRAAAVAAMAGGDLDGLLAHATAAVDQYRGEFLPGGYDDWLLDARSELEGRCVHLIDLVCRTRADRGDLSGAVEAARRRIQLRPLEEVGYRRLMELQGELGDRAGAVNTYHHCASVLERELGVEPDPATRESLNRLLARRTATAAPVSGRVDERVGPVGGRLVGRTAELDALQGVWRAAVAGRPRLAVVRGDPGVGKTRLVTEIAEVAGATGAVVATAQCFGTAGQLALAPVADWLRTPVVQSTIAELEPVWRVEVSRLVPTATGRPEPGAGGRAMSDAWQRHRFFEGLSRALIGAGRPILLVLDNLQWCDEETLDFLAFCLGLTTDSPVMVAATVRTDDQHPKLLSWIARMRATGMLTDIELGPMDGVDTARLAEGVTGRPLTEDEVDLLQATTGGFPLYVIEAVRSGVDLGAAPLPVGDLTAVLRLRLEQLTGETREVAGLAAAVGRNFSLDLLTEASDLDADGVVHAVDEMWRRRIVRAIGDGYDFSHDLLRDAAYAQVSPPKRWLLHRRLAQGLELLHADDPDAVSAQLAEQYAHGGRADRALGHYRRAAELAVATFAYAEAVRLDREALAIVRAQPDGRNRDLQELAVLEDMAAPLNARHGFASPRLRETLERSIVLAETLGRRDATVSGLVGLWTSLFVAGQMADAHRTAHRALALVEPGSPFAAPAHLAVAGSSVSLGRPAEALAHFELAVTLPGADRAVSVGTRADVHGRAWAAHAHWLLGEDDQALARCEEAIALARTIDKPFWLTIALAYAGITHQLRDDLPALARTVSELRELCNRYDLAYYREWGSVLHGWCTGGEAGLELAQRGVDTLAVDGSLTRMPYWLSLVADLAARCGRPDAARATLDAALLDGQARADVWWLPEVMRMRATHDDPPAAAGRLRAAWRLAAEHGSVALVGRCERDLAALGVRSPALAVRPPSSEPGPPANGARTPRS